MWARVSLDRIILMTDKILLALQFWHGDAAQAMQLAQFLAELQQGHSEEADFLFISRFDTPHNRQAISSIARKFNTFTHRCPRKGTGWPAGCNDLWRGTLEWTYGGIANGKLPEYKAIFTFEADGVPLVRDWVSQLSQGWSEARERQPHQLLSVWGAYLEVPGPHINGNCFFSGDQKFLKWVVNGLDEIPPYHGWDCYLWKAFKQWGAVPTNLIHSLWRTQTFDEKQHRIEVNSGAAWVHGVKDDSLLRISKNFLISG